MNGRHDISLTIPWMRQGTEYFRTALRALTDDRFPAPSALSGWTCAHVVGHVARNAEAVLRLATWARSGVETPMYGDRHPRAAEIEKSAVLPPDVLRAEVAGTALALDDALAEFSAAHWRARVRSALGRDIPAAELPWMRLREVWLHALDLGTAASVRDLPAGVVDLLLDDVCAALSQREQCPAVLVAPTDRQRTWLVGAATAGPAHRVAAPAAVVVGWLTGRIAGSALDATAPQLPRWL